jgi:hypothetical protein
MTKVPDPSIGSVTQADHAGQENTEVPVTFTLKINGGHQADVDGGTPLLWVLRVVLYEMRLVRRLSNMACPRRFLG